MNRLIVDGLHTKNKRKTREKTSKNSISQPPGIRGERNKMRCIVKNEIYVHRNIWITRYNQGIGTEFDLNLFRTFADARRYIDKKLDGTHDREPEIIGEWSEENE